jgi:hypothetical protein
VDWISLAPDEGRWLAVGSTVMNLFNKVLGIFD